MDGKVPPDFDLDMLTISACGPTFKSKRPLNVLAPFVVARDVDGEPVPHLLQLNLLTGLGRQILLDDSKAEGKPILRDVQVAHVEIKLPCWNPSTSNAVAPQS